MNNENKMLRLVLSDNNLSSSYEYSTDDFASVDEALRSDNPVIVAIAKIIRGVNERSDKSTQKEVYNEVFNYLNQNIL